MYKKKQKPYADMVTIYFRLSISKYFKENLNL